VSRHSTATLTAIGAIAFIISACSSTVGGEATPNPTTGGSVGSTAPSTSASTANPFEGMKPCALLDQVLAGQGYPAAHPSTADAKQSCASDKPGDSTVGLALQNGQLFDQNISNPGKAVTGSVNDRPAVQEREPIGAAGQCSVTMEVKPGSRALVSLSGGKTTDEACDRINAIATKLEPLLPKNN
jgi:hypothetical protein